MEPELLLRERYPEIGWHLSYTAFQPSTDPEEDRSAIQKKIAEIDLVQTEVLYVYGLGQGYFYEALQNWLAEKRFRRLIFLEDQLSAIHRFLNSPLSASMLSNAQAHLCFIPDRERGGEVLEEIVQTFPTDRIAATLHPSYAKYRAKWAKWRLQLFRASCALHALFSEEMFASHLFSNLWSNVKRLPGAFYANDLRERFQGVPAVLCGAGPSLAASLQDLSALEDKALIIAGGSALSALSKGNILPHFGMALDPNKEEYTHLEPSDAFEVPILSANRVCKEIFPLFNGPLGYLRSGTGGSFENWVEEELGIAGDVIGPELGREALSVTTLAIAYAVALGCNPIIFVGVDLAYTGMQRYAEGVLPSSAVSKERFTAHARAGEKAIKKLDIFGKPTQSLVKWVMESESIAAFAKEHPDRLFLNATQGGIGFSGIPNISLQEAAQLHCQTSFDLRGKIHAEIERNRFAETYGEKIEEVREKLQGSIKTILQIIAKITEELDRIEKEPDLPLETGIMTLLLSDFQEGVAAQALFPALLPVLDCVLERSFFPLTERDIYLGRERAKWSHVKEAAERYLSVLES